MFSPRYSTILAFLTTLYSVQLSHRCVVAEIDKCTNYSGESCKNCVEQDGCAYCEKTKACMAFDLVKDTLNNACEDQEWKHKQCVVECTTYSGGSCKDCVDQSGCAYCEKNKECMKFDLFKDTLKKACEGQEWKFKQCVVTGKILLIALPVTGFVVLVALICFVYCCCCRRKRNSSKDEKEDAKLRKQRKVLKERHKEREKERREKRDEIRKKYDLLHFVVHLNQSSDFRESRAHRVHMDSVEQLQ